jgi:hypothetical protein
MFILLPNNSPSSYSVDDCPAAVDECPFKEADPYLWCLKSCPPDRLFERLFDGGGCVIQATSVRLCLIAEARDRLGATQTFVRTTQL